MRDQTLATLKARHTAYRMVAVQMLAVILAALIWGFAKLSWPIGYSVLLGGLVIVLPSFGFARCLFNTTRATQASRIVMTLFVGEFAKLILVGILAVLVIKFLPVLLWPFVVGLLVAQIGFWLAPLLIKNK